MKSVLTLSLMIGTLLLSDCSKDEFKPSSEEKCRVGRYVYAQASGKDLSYDITYVEGSLTRPSVITEEMLSGDTWFVNSTYKHIYENDSLYIKDFKLFTEGDTYLSALYDTKIQSVTTSFPNNAAIYRYTFDYAQTDKLTITLDEMNGNTAICDSRGTYNFDERGDVVRLEVLRNADRYPGEPTTLDITYTYDIVLNPIKELVLPHFINAALPEATYFSMHNRVTETSDGATKNYNITYGTDPMPNQILRANGVTEKFDYPNCTN